jgi:hypothetical protein
MKKLFVYSLALLAICCSVFSCQKDSTTTEEIPELGEANFSVMLNDNPYVVENGLKAYAYQLDSHCTINGVGLLDNNETVTLVLPHNFTVGTYELVPQGEIYAIAIIDDIHYSTQLPGSNGQIIITDFDGQQVSGSFFFNAKGGDYLEHSLQAKEGAFNVTFR